MFIINMEKDNQEIQKKRHISIVVMLIFGLLILEVVFFCVWIANNFHNYNLFVTNDYVFIIFVILIIVATITLLYFLPFLITTNSKGIKLYFIFRVKVIEYKDIKEIVFPIIEDGRYTEIYANFIFNDGKNMKISYGGYKGLYNQLKLIKNIL